MDIDQEDTTHHPVLSSGVTVTNLRGVLEGVAGPAPTGLGTLGFFGAERGAAGAAPVLVSSRHVLFAYGARPTEPVYQPEFSRRGDSYEFRSDSLYPIATLCHEGLEGHHRYRYAGEVEDDYFVDCAAARLDEKYRARFRPALPEPGIGGKTRIARTRRVVGADRDVRVYKWGRKTGLTSGRLLDVKATVTGPGGVERRNVIVVKNDESACFADDGDSGALLVNGRAEPVGLVWGKSETEPSIAFACHIHPVLDCLGLSLLTHAPSRRRLATAHPHGALTADELLAREPAPTRPS
jgi:hypothetical protein